MVIRNRDTSDVETKARKRGRKRLESAMSKIYKPQTELIVNNDNGDIDAIVY